MINYKYAFLKTFIHFAFCMLQTALCNAQNLVPNCSFEDTISCPGGAVGLISFCRDWHSAGTDLSSPDYYKACGQYPSVPHNAFGFQYAATGNSYIGIIPFYKDTALQVGKEFVCARLITEMNIGMQYYVSFKINFTVCLQSGYASNKIGILFSTADYNNANPAPVNNFAHVYTDSIITDTVNWVKISGLFIADSAYQYISIGNFFDEAHTDTIKIYNSPYWDEISYYCIEDVCVTLDSNQCSCDSQNYINKEKFEDLIFYYYNSESKNIIIKNSNPANEKILIRIYDVLGRFLFKSFLQGDYNEIPVYSFSKGVYILNFQMTDKSFNSKIFIH